MDYARLPWRPAGRRRFGSSGGGVIKRCCLSDQESKGAYRYPDGDIRQPLHLISGGGRYGDPKLVGHATSESTQIQGFSFSREFCADGGTFGYPEWVAL